MSADKQATFTIKLLDFMTGTLGKVSASLAVLRQGWLAVSSVVQTGIGIMQSMLNEYSAQETAINKVNIALKNQGIVSQEVTQDYMRFASEMQKTTVFADEQVMEMEALLATFGLVGDQMKTTIRLATDLSVGLGIDLRTATMMLGKAALGETGTLTRYGIVIDSNISKAEKFAEVQKQVSERFGGSAAAQTETYAGKVAQLANAFNEIKETLGSFMVGPATSFLKWLNDSAVAFNRYIAGPEKANGIYEKQITNLRQLIAFKEKEIQMAAEEGVTNTAKDDQLKTLEKSLAWYEEKNKQRNDDHVKEIIDTQQHNEQLKALEAQRTADAKKQAEDRAKNMLSTLQFISSMSTSHNKALATIGKAAAISTATIDTYAAANKALASAPPPWNFALAALVTTAGLANVANISGMKLAEGGMVMPKSGGVSAVMAEAGRAEVAIPLDDQRTKEKLRDVFGGGGTNIIIQAGTIVADEYSVQQFAQKIDEKLFELKRNGRSYQ